MSLPRCCSDTLKKLKPSPSDGLEVACRWCENVLRYERIGTSQIYGWMPHERTADFVQREADPLAVARREGRYSQLTKGRYDARLKDIPSVQSCERCALAGQVGVTSVLERITGNGIALYRCPAKHATYVDHSTTVNEREP